MNATSSDILEDIEGERRELGRDVDRLKQTTSEDVRRFMTNVRAFVEEQPMTALAIAAGAGIVLSGFITHDARGHVPPERSEVTETLQSVKDALMAVAQRESKTFIQNVRAGA